MSDPACVSGGVAVGIRGRPSSGQAQFMFMLPYVGVHRFTFRVECLSDVVMLRIAELSTSLDLSRPLDPL
jgi:hypothetical protein